VCTNTQHAVCFLFHEGKSLLVHITLQRCLTARQIQATEQGVVLLAARWDALEAVVPDIRRLAELDGGEGGVRCTGQGAQQAADQGGLSHQPAAAPTKECLLAIGDHIDGGGSWMASKFPAAGVWRMVVEATGHRMGSEQLAALYKGIKLQQGKSGGGSVHPQQREGMCLGCSWVTAGLSCGMPANVEETGNACNSMPSIARM
jgi:hypothetical protein